VREAAATALGQQRAGAATPALADAAARDADPAVRAAAARALDRLRTGPATGDSPAAQPDRAVPPHRN
jgi:HEAT repeat protein